MQEEQIILVDKPAGISSFGAVARVRKKLTETYTFLHENDTLTEQFIMSLPEEEQNVCNALNRRTEFKVLKTTYKLF